MITVAGLPIHPLVVHAVVVLVPLGTLAALAVAVRPRWNRTYAPLAAAAAVLGALSATVAKLTGDQLLARLERLDALPAATADQLADHGRFGLWTVVVAWPFAVAAVATAVLGRREGTVPGAVRAAAAVAALLGLVAGGLTALAGHSGATAVWGWVAGG